MPGRRVGRSVTKSVDVRTTPERAFDYLSDATNWPEWSIVNLKSVTPGKDGWYETVTREGHGQLKLLSNKAFGLLDHVWKDPRASWMVHARVIPNGDGCTFLITLHQPPTMDDSTFDAAMEEMDIEMNRLREALEAMSGSAE
jgi:uncharacterized protein YndB with AHSA1/START domain